MKSYIPARGDIVWLNFDPQVGHEHSGHRPALVLSPSEYNERIGLLLCCPMTNQVKGYPFAVLVDGNPKKGAILADQVKVWIGGSGMLKRREMSLKELWLKWPVKLRP